MRATDHGSPCPFCGVDADSVHGVSKGDSHYYECGQCKARGPVVTSRYFGNYDEHLDPTDQAWRAWNHRPEGGEADGE